MTTLRLSAHERVTIVGESPELLEAEALYEPGGRPPPPHLHPAQDERFTVVDGVIRVRTPAGERLHRAGESFDVPRGTPHAMANGGDETARVRWEVRPALRTAAFWSALSRARTPLGLLLAALRFRAEFRLARLKT